MRKKQLDIEQAIKGHYKTAPLKINLAVTVADKVLPKKKRSVPAPEIVLYFIAFIIAVGSFIYCLHYLGQLPVSSGLVLLFLPAIFYFGLSIKEMSLLFRKAKEP
jgi:hypothetical protein